jgi:hypothetical protein
MARPRASVIGEPQVWYSRLRRPGAVFLPPQAKCSSHYGESRAPAIGEPQFKVVTRLRGVSHAHDLKLMSF